MVAFVIAPTREGSEMSEETETTTAEQTDTDTGKATEPDWKAEADKWKALARKHESQAKSNAEAAKKLAELEEKDKTEGQRAADKATQAEKTARAAQAEAYRLRVAIRKGLTETQAKRLVGETEEELEADADELLASFSPGKGDNPGKDDTSGRPKERLRPGATTTDEPESDDPMTLVKDLPRL